MSILSSKKRAKLPKGDFALPGKGEQKTIKAKVKAKYPNIGKA